jgi:hypothetical protein
MNDEFLESIQIGMGIWFVLFLIVFFVFIRER